jgi:hypothetical protein
MSWSAFTGVPGVAMVLVLVGALMLAAASWWSVRGARHRTAFRVAAALMWAGVGSFLLFAAAGSTVDDAGVLREPFGLLPLGWALWLAGLAVGAVAFLRRSRAAT